MKIAYIVNTGLAEGWAHSVQIMNMCSSFSLNGAEVVLVIPKRNDLPEKEIFKYYGIKKNFFIKKIPFLDFAVGHPNKIFYFLRFVSFYIGARFFVWFNHFDILYSRDFFSPLFFPLINLEQHSFPKKITFIHKIVFKLVRKSIVLTSFIKNKLLENGIDERNILVASDAVDLDKFQKGEKINSGFIKDKNDFVFGYTGTLKTMGMEKGVSVGIESLKYLPRNYKFLVVGGEREDVEFYKLYSKNCNVSERVIFIGKVLHKEMPNYMSECDALIAPFPSNKHFDYYMSPLKIFEYMASKKPIIATSLPSLKEVLSDGENAILIPPSDPESLARAVVRLKENPEFARKIADNSYLEASKKYTWDIRAEKILYFINSK